MTCSAACSPETHRDLDEAPLGQSWTGPVKKPGLDGHAWPSPIQELALRAGLGDHDAAAAAWVELAPLIETDAGRDHEVQRLLPLVGHNLRRVGVVDAPAEALSPMTRRNWYRSRTIIEDAGPALAALAEAEVPTIVLKGTVLAVAYYEHRGLRYLSDVDVLVHHTDADRSFDVLAAAGWARPGQGSRDRLLRVRHSVGLRHDTRSAIDLHWRVSMPLVIQSDLEHSEDDFWDAADPIEIAGIPTAALCPADLILHACVHGAWTSSDGTARWAADAMTVLAVAGDRVDWDRLVRQAELRHVVVLMRNDLAYLAQELDAPVPDWVIDRLRRSPVTRREARMHWTMTRAEVPSGFRASTRRFQGFWSEQTGSLPAWRRLRELPGHLKDSWGLAHAWEIPLEASSRLLRHLRGLRGPRDGA